jgi:alpha-tubulin suppressor-like RCC1 family protein
LGDGTTTAQTIPVQTLVVSNIIQVSGGYYHSLFLASNGIVYGAGSNNYGQLGSPDQTSIPVPTPLTNIIQIAAGLQNSYFLASNGTVYAVGENDVLFRND